MPSTDSTQATKTQPTDQDGWDADTENSFQLKSFRFWMIIVAVYFSIFLVALDRLIIVTAIPSITDEFRSIEDVAWYGSAYMLTAAISTPLSGRVYQLYSTKYVFISTIIVFEVGSALCGAAPNSTAFILGRAIAGLGAGGIMTGGMMIIIPLVPLPKRPVFTSLFGIAFGISSILGPLIGGAFTDASNLTWRWCFYVNLPIGGFTVAVILLFLHLETKPREKLSLLNQAKRLDPLGLVFFGPAIVCLILALQWGGTTDSWSSPKIIGLLVTFGVTFIAFLVVEALTPKTAMAPTRVVLNRSVGSSMLFMFLLSGSMMVVVYYLPYWFQAVQNLSAIQSGIRTFPVVLALVIFGIVAAIFTQKIGYYVPGMLLSPILCAIGAGLLSTLKPGAGSGEWIGYQVLYGLGIGSGFQISTLVPQKVLAGPDVPLGVSMMFFMQQLGGSVFIPVAQNIFSRKLISGISGIADLNPQTIVHTGATELRNVVPVSDLDHVVDAYSYAVTRVFVVAAGLSACQIICALAVEWKSIKATKKQSSETKDSDVEEAKEDSKA